MVSSCRGRRPLAALAAACSDATGPADATGAYALQRLGAEPLPAAIGGTAGSGFTSVVAETLPLDAGGAAHLESRRHHGAGYARGYDPADTYDFTVAGSGTWERRGDTVVVGLAYAADRDPRGAAGHAGVLRLYPDANGLTEYRDPLASAGGVRVSRREPARRETR